MDFFQPLGVWDGIISTTSTTMINFVLSTGNNMVNKNRGHVPGLRCLQFVAEEREWRKTLAQ